MVKKIEIITNDEKLLNKGISNKKLFLIVCLFIFMIVFLLSTTLELKEEKAKNMWFTFFLILTSLGLLFYFKIIG